MGKNILLYLAGYPRQLNATKWKGILAALQPLKKTSNLPPTAEASVRAEEATLQDITRLQTDLSEAFLAEIASRQQEMEHTVFICTEPIHDIEVFKNFEGVISTADIPEIPKFDQLVWWQLRLENENIKFSDSHDLINAERLFSLVLTNNTEQAHVLDTFALEANHKISRIPGLNPVAALQEIKHKVAQLKDFKKEQIQTLSNQLKIPLIRRRELCPTAIKLVSLNRELKEKLGHLLTELEQLPDSLKEKRSVKEHIEHLSELATRTIRRQRQRTTLAASLTPMPPLLAITSPCFQNAPLQIAPKEPPPYETVASARPSIFEIQDVPLIQHEHLAVQHSLLTDRKTDVQLPKMPPLLKIDDRHYPFAQPQTAPKEPPLYETVASVRQDMFQETSVSPASAPINPSTDTFDQFVHQQIFRKRPAASATVTSEEQAKQQTASKYGKQPKLK